MPKQKRRKAKKSKATKSKSKPSKSKSYEQWHLICIVAVAIISVLFSFFSAGGLPSSIIGQIRTPAQKQQFKQLRHAINKLDLSSIEHLVVEYQFDFKHNNHQNRYSDGYHRFHDSIDQFLHSWSEKINDDQYDLRLNILQTLIQNTNIQEQTQWCLCNEAIKLRLIDASELILSAMSPPAIKHCFSAKSPKTNNSIFHHVTKSRSASFARWILKLGYADNPKLQLAAKRLYLDIPDTYSAKTNNIVLQTDMKQIQSFVDVDSVIAAAQRAGLDEQWLFARNSENYTGYDYWMLNNGMEKQTLPKEVKQILDANKDSMKYANIAHSVSMEFCDFNQQILFDNSCSPPVIYGWKDFHVYWQQQRPVIIRHTGLNADDRVTFDSFIQRFGGLSVMVAEIPYATLFGQKAWSIPLKEYSDVVLKGEHASNLYAFDKSVISNNVELQQWFNLSVQYMEEGTVRNGYDKTYQLAFGPSNSGAPPHWHQPAFNGLYQGKKMWWMFAPKDSIYSAMNVVSWIQREYKQKWIQQGDARRHYCFIQEKGDIVFVPQDWSHAVNNLQPSLAVAIEYDI